MTEILTVIIISLVFILLIIANFHFLNKSDQSRKLLIIISAIVAIFSIATFVLFKVLIANEVMDGDNFIVRLIEIFIFGFVFIELYNIYRNKQLDKENKNLLKLNTHPLNSFHLKKVEDYLLEKESTYKSTHKANSKLSIKDFIDQNQTNLSEYIKLKNQEHNILTKIFEDSYSQFSSVFLENIYLLRKEKRLLPSKIATTLGKIFDEKFKIQLNTSNYSFEGFYTNYSSEIIKQNKNNVSKRIIFIDELPNLETINTSETNGLGKIFKKLEKISYFLWIYEWHKLNNDQLFFVLKDDAIKLQKKLNSTNIRNQVESIDFSINYDTENDNEKLVLINHLEEANSIKFSIVKDEKIPGVKIEITNSAKTYLEFFKTLLNHTIDINSILENHKKNHSSLYI